MKQLQKKANRHNNTMNSPVVRIAVYHMSVCHVSLLQLC